MSFLSKNPLVKKIVEGEPNEELLDLVVNKQLPFTDEEYLESLVFVLKLEKFKSKAHELLKQIPESTKTNYMEKSDANHRVAYYILIEGINEKNLKFITRAIRNQFFPIEFLLKIAEKGDNSMLEVLLDNQIKLIAYPEIMDKMEQNPDVNNFIKGKIKEIRDFYLNPEAATQIPVEEVLQEVKEIASSLAQKEGEENTDEESKTNDSLDLSKIEQKTISLLTEINNMTISERIKLAIGGSRTHRLILVKDPNKLVALSVMESPKITMDEVILLARNKSLPSEIITKISRHREWIKNYPVVLELVQNPKTPIQDAVGFVKKLHGNDLRLLSRDKNVSPTVRQMAYNFLNQKSSSKG